MATTYKYGNITIHGFGSVQLDIAKIIDGKVVGVQSFKLRLHPVPEGQDPVAVAIAKHRSELHW